MDNAEPHFFEIQRQFADEYIYLCQISIEGRTDWATPSERTSDTVEGAAKLISKALSIHRDVEWRVAQINVIEGTCRDIGDDIKPLLRPLDYENKCPKCWGSGIVSCSHRYGHERGDVTSMGERCGECNGEGFFTATPHEKPEIPSHRWAAQ